MPDSPLGPNLSFKRRREHVRHKSGGGKRTNHKETSSPPSLTGKRKMEIPILSYHVRSTVVSDTGEAQFDVSFNVRITLTFVLFSILFFFTDSLSC